MATTETKTTYIGAAVERKEDARLLRGDTRWVDNMTLPGMLWMAVVRSPYAHAKITKVDISQALAADGVVAAFSGADLAEEWAGSLPCAWPVTGDCHIPQHRPLTTDKARYAGDGVAVVVAESRVLAKDAAELVEVDDEPLPAVTDVAEAVTDSAPLVHDEYENNKAFTWPLQAGEIDQLFADAAVTVKENYRQQRLIPNAIEPRSVLVQPTPATGEYTMWSATQVPHIARVTLSGTTGIPETKLRVVAPDVGGGFGSKLNVYAEEALCLVLARRLGLPVKWTEERWENYVATIHGRDVLQEIELAATEEGKITAVRVRLTAAMGAYMQLVSPGIPLLGAWLYAGCYECRATTSSASASSRTRRRPTLIAAPAGRRRRTPSSGLSTCSRERREGPDRDPAAELHHGVPRRDRVRARDRLRQFPRLARQGARARRLRRPAQGTGRAAQAGRREAARHRFLDLCRDVRARAFAHPRGDPLRGGRLGRRDGPLPADGTVQVLIGTSPHGQGHVTTFSQIVADRLGVPIENVEVLHGDTTIIPLGMDTYGSRSLAVGGVAVWHATEKIIGKARKIAAHELEVPRRISNTRVAASPSRARDKSMSVTDAALSAWTAHNLPDGTEPGTRGHRGLRPAQLQLARRLPYRGRRDRRG